MYRKWSFSKMDRLWILIIYYLPFLSNTMANISYFSDIEIERVQLLHKNWANNGYKNVLDLVSCDGVTKKLTDAGYDNSTQQYWNKHYRECNHHQMLQMCGSHKQNEMNLVPHSHICDNNIVEYSNYHICVTQKENFMKSHPCTIISIGSNNLWQFEEAAYQNHANCDIHTFDPREFEKHSGITGGRITVPTQISNRTYFHRYAIGRKVGNNMGIQILPYLDILKMSNVTKNAPLSILKIDCEGCEHPLFSSLGAANLFDYLPPQVIMEVHVIPDIHSYVRKGELKSYSELFKLFIDHGYAVFSNRIGDGGCEVSFVKLINKKIADMFYV